MLINMLIVLAILILTIGCFLLGALLVVVVQDIWETWRR